jgi:hypothetical protein
MARPQFADGGNGIQRCKVPANIEPARGGPPALSLGVGISHLKI